MQPKSMKHIMGVPEVDALELIADDGTTKNAFPLLILQTNQGEFRVRASVQKSGMEFVFVLPAMPFDLTFEKAHVAFEFDDSSIEEIAEFKVEGSTDAGEESSFVLEWAKDEG